MKDMKAERDRQIAELWLACYTEEEIAEKVGVDQATVNRTMEEPCKADTWQKCMIFSTYTEEEIAERAGTSVQPVKDVAKSDNLDIWQKNLIFAQEVQPDVG